MRLWPSGLANWNPWPATVKFEVTPLAVGVPEMTPVFVLRVRPAGRLPAITLQVIGAVPPRVCRVWEYTLVTEPFGSEGVVIENEPELPFAFPKPMIAKEF